MTTSRTVQYYASTIHVRSDNVEDVRVLIAKLQVALDAVQEQQRDDHVRTPDQVRRDAWSCRYQLEDSAADMSRYPAVHGHLAKAIQECVRMEKYGTVQDPIPPVLPQALLDKAHQKAFEILDDHGSLRDAVGQAIKLVLAEI